MKKKNFFLQFFSKHFLNSLVLKIPMIASEKSNQDLSDYNQILFIKKFDVKKITDFF